MLGGVNRGRGHGVVDGVNDGRGRHRGVLGGVNRGRGYGSIVHRGRGERGQRRGSSHSRRQCLN